ncbi:dimethylamine monooxygenase subunit DmmA family protein [Nguyenibacter vanlangensis]|nr:dimethylamine monooxygenase subunit DmmA family protein [Nguyenibacter vanlangensis]
MPSASLFPFRSLMWDSRGRRHLMVRDRSDLPLPGGPRPAAVEIWSVVHDSRAVPSREAAEVHFRSAAQLLESLVCELHAAHIGLRLYGAGGEAFLSAVARQGAAAGLCDEEMALASPAGAGRPVICVHCDTVAPSVAGDNLVCAGCGAELEVRPHFSRRLAAYLGVWRGPFAEARADGI